jgi:probable phosphoglycerate mutase
LRAIVLCRHGATESNSAGRFLSTADPPLSALGRAQCEAMRDRLAGIRLARAVVSPMRRCLETREIIAPQLPFRTDPDLREIDFGAWEGKTLEWLEQHDAPGLGQRRRDPVRFRPAGGESFEDVAARLPALVDSLRHGPDTLVIAHRGTLGVLERLLRLLPLDSRSVEPLEPAELRVLQVP